MTQALGALTERVAGPVIRPGDEGYEEARRVYNAMIDARPAAVVRCASEDDVVAVVRLRRREGDGRSPSAAAGTACRASAPPTARSWPTCRGMQSVASTTRAHRDGRRRHHVGPRSTTSPPRTAWPPPAASSPPPGVGGLTLGRGHRLPGRATGSPATTSCRRASSPRTASCVTANAEENPDLFWALRGGGGNFGVVTEFTFRVHPVPTSGGPMFFELSDGPAVFRYFRRADRRRAAGVRRLPGFHLAPPLPFMPRGPGRASRSRPSSRAGPATTEEGSGSSTGSARSPRRSPEMVGAMPYPALNSPLRPAACRPGCSTTGRRPSSPS